MLLDQRNVVRKIGDLMKKVYLIDFGLATKYWDDSTDEHMPDVVDENFNGNMIFCSVNQLRGHSFSRRDDIIMIIQSLIFLRDWKRDWVENFPNRPG